MKAGSSTFANDYDQDVPVNYDEKTGTLTYSDILEKSIAKRRKKKLKKASKELRENSRVEENR